MFVLPHSLDTKSHHKSPNQFCRRSVHLIVRDEIRPVLTNLVVTWPPLTHRTLNHGSQGSVRSQACRLGLDLNITRFPRDVCVVKSKGMSVPTVWIVTGTVVDVRDFDLSWWPILMYHYFDLSWLVPTNLVEFVWLVCWRPPISCYFADHSQLSPALVYHKARLIASVLSAMTLSCYHVLY